MPCRLQLLSDCTEAHLLIIPFQALTHIATIVAVSLPKCRFICIRDPLITEMNMHASLQADPSSSEPQLNNGVDNPQVPAVPAAPAMPPSVPAAPDALNVPADAGDIAGGGMQTAREEKRKVCNLSCASSTLQVCKFLAARITSLHALVMLSTRLQHVTKLSFSSCCRCSILADKLMPLCQLPSQG